MDNRADWTEEEALRDAMLKHRGCGFAKAETGLNILSSVDPRSKALAKRRILSCG